MCFNNSFKFLNHVAAVFMAVVMCMTIFSSTVVTVNANGNVYDYDSYTVEYNIVSEWSGYQNIEITLTNTGAEPIYNWMLAYDFCGKIQGIWNEIIKNKSAYFVC